MQKTSCEIPPLGARTTFPPQTPNSKLIPFFFSNNIGTIHLIVAVDFLSKTLHKVSLRCISFVITVAQSRLHIPLQHTIGWWQARAHQSRSSSTKLLSMSLLWSGRLGSGLDALGLWMGCFLLICILPISCFSRLHLKSWYDVVKWSLIGLVTVPLFFTSHPNCMDSRPSRYLDSSKLPLVRRKSTSSPPHHVGKLCPKL